MRKTSKRQYSHLDQSLCLLKRQWFALPEIPRWRLLRSIAGREHLHVTHYLSAVVIELFALIVVPFLGNADWQLQSLLYRGAMILILYYLNIACQKDPRVGGLKKSALGAGPNKSFK